MRHFDYEKVAKQAKIPAPKLARLRAIIRREFPKDDMLFELQMLRVCTSIRDSRLTIDQALADDAEAAA
jgi:hypothetical protein